MCKVILNNVLSFKFVVIWGEYKYSILNTKKLLKSTNLKTLLKHFYLNYIWPIFILKIEWNEETTTVSKKY